MRQQVHSGRRAERKAVHYRPEEQANFLVSGGGKAGAKPVLSQYHAIVKSDRRAWIFIVHVA